MEIQIQILVIPLWEWVSFVIWMVPLKTLEVEALFPSCYTERLHLSSGAGGQYVVEHNFVLIP